LKPITVRRWALWGGIAAVALIALALALRPAPVEVDVASVSRGRLAVTLDEEGETRVRERYIVSAPVAGRLKRIELEPGDPVRARTTVLATFVPGDPALLDRRARGEVEARVGAARAGEQRARAESDRARAQLDLSRSEHTRIRRLAESGVSSQEDLDRAKQNLESAQSTLSAAERAAAGALQELRAAQAPKPFNPIGIGWAGPTILAAGDDWQRERFLWPLLRGEEFWCQLFSEPGAGSDLAGLSTRAEPDGEDWIVDGQKVRVFNDRGATVLPAKVTDRIARGVVSIKEGAWFTPTGDGTDTRGCANVLTPDRASPCGASTYNTARVDVGPA